MKITAVRLIENKDPVGVFGGWVSDSSLDLNLILECMDTSECEFIETEILKGTFGVIWPKVRKEEESIPSEMKFTLELDQDIRDIFTVGYFLWEKFSAHQEQQSERSRDNRIKDLNNEIDYLKKTIVERDEGTVHFLNNDDTSTMFMFAAWVVAFISIVLLILK